LGLWSLEGPGKPTAGILDYLRQGLPVPIDNVIVVEDESTVREGLDEVHQSLDSGMRLIEKTPLLRVYQRDGER
jgi:hypothetical protein